MPTYDRVHLASCLADAVRSAVENLRDDASVSHLTFHHVINGGTYRGDSLYSIAYTYLEEGLVRCSCGAISTKDTGSFDVIVPMDEHPMFRPGDRPQAISTLPDEDEARYTVESTGSVSYTEPEVPEVECSGKEPGNASVPYCRHNPGGCALHYPSEYTGSMSLAEAAQRGMTVITDETEGATSSTEVSGNQPVLRAGEWAYIVDEVGGTFAFSTPEDATTFYLSENDGGAQNLHLFKYRAPAGFLSWEAVAEAACVEGPTVEDDEGATPSTEVSGNRVLVTLEVDTTDTGPVETWDWDDLVGIGTRLVRVEPVAERSDDEDDMVQESGVYMSCMNKRCRVRAWSGSEGDHCPGCGRLAAIRHPLT